LMEERERGCCQLHLHLTFFVNMLLVRASCGEASLLCAATPRIKYGYRQQWNSKLYTISLIKNEILGLWLSLWCYVAANDDEVEHCRGETRLDGVVPYLLGVALPFARAFGVFEVAWYGCAAGDWYPANAEGVCSATLLSKEREHKEETDGLVVRLAPGVRESGVKRTHARWAVEYRDLALLKGYWFDGQDTIVARSRE